MRARKPTGSFAPPEVQRFILPISFFSIVIMAGLILEDLFNGSSLHVGFLVYGLTVIAGTIINYFVIVRTADFQETYGWLNAGLSGIGLGLLPYILPMHLNEAAHILIPFGVIAAAIVSGRPYAYATLLIILSLNLPYVFGLTEFRPDILDFGMPFIISFIIMEAVLNIKDTTQHHIQRLETINTVSRQIMLSLDREQTLLLLDATIQEALEAETYFIGLLRDEEIHLDLFHDEGQYYNGEKVPVEGTLSGWVIT